MPGDRPGKISPAFIVTAVSRVFGFRSASSCECFSYECGCSDCGVPGTGADDVGGVLRGRVRWDDGAGADGGPGGAAGVAVRGLCAGRDGAGDLRVEMVCGVPPAAGGSGRDAGVGGARGSGTERRLAGVCGAAGAGASCGSAVAGAGVAATVRCVQQNVAAGCGDLGIWSGAAVGWGGV